MNSTKHNLTLYMALAALGFLLWSLAAYQPAQIAFLSTSVSALAVLILSPWLGGLKQTFTMPKLKLRLLRALVIACSGFLSFIAFMNMDLATAYAIIFIAPLIAKILSVVLLGEQIRLRSWLISALGLMGVLIVLRPGMIPLSIGSMAALALAVFFALGYVMGRKIGAENQTMLSLSLFQYGFMALGTAVPALQNFEPMTMPEYATIILSGLAAVTGSITVGTAFNKAPSASIAPIHYTQMMWGVLFGALLFGEFPDIWTIIGGAVVMVAGLLLIRFTRPV